MDKPFGDKYFSRDRRILLLEKCKSNSWFFPLMLVGSKSYIDFAATDVSLFNESFFPFIKVNAE